MTTIPQLSFAGGVLSGTLPHRSDLERVRAGLAVGDNWFVSKYGSACNRSGTRYVGQAKQSRPAWLPFEFDEDDNYALELGDGYMRFVDAQLEEYVRVPDDAVTWNFPDIIYEQGQAVLYQGTYYTARVSHDSEFATQPGIGQFWETVWYELDDDVYEIPTPYTKAQARGDDGLRAVSARQVNDRLYIAHDEHPPYQLTRFEQARWTLDPLPILPPTAGPANVTLTTANGAAGSFEWRWKLSGIDRETGKEALTIPGELQDSITSIATNADQSQVIITLDTFDQTALDALDGKLVMLGPIPLLTLGSGTIPFNLNEADEQLNALMEFREFVADTSTTLGVITIDLDTTDTVLEASTTYFTSPSFDLHLSYFPLGVEQTFSGNMRVELEFTKPPEIDEVYIYRSGDLGDVYGFVGSSRGTTWSDEGADPRYDETPLIYRNPFDRPNRYPALVEIWADRLVFLSPKGEPGRASLSATAQFEVFSRRSPNGDDDAFDVFITGGSQEIRATRVLGQVLLVHTNKRDITLRGDQDGLVSESTVTQRVESDNGSARLEALRVNKTGLYVQRQAGLVLDVNYVLGDDGWVGNDLTAYAATLLAGKRIVSWAYARAPNSSVYMVLDDGTMLAFTYLREQGIEAWSTFNTRGTKTQGLSVLEAEGNALDEFDRVLTLSATGYDAPWVAVERKINGATVTYLEILSDRKNGAADYDLRRDATFLDSYKTFDGTNTTDDEIRAFVGGGVQSWVDGGLISLEIRNLSGPVEDPFALADVTDNLGRRLLYTTDTGTLVEFEVILTQFVDASTVRGLIRNIRVDGELVTEVPAEVQAVYTSAWVELVRLVTGLEHLENEQVYALLDGEPVTGERASSGQLTLPMPAGIVHVGMPIYDLLSPMPLSLLGFEQSTLELKKALTAVLCRFFRSRGAFAGPTPELLSPFPVKHGFDGAGDPVDPLALWSENVTVGVKTQNDVDADAFVRAGYPLPVEILSLSRFIELERPERNR